MAPHRAAPGNTVAKGLAVTIALFTLVLVSCQNPNKQHHSAVFPTGFAEAYLPEIDLTAYLYFSQPTPFEMPWRLFLSAQYSPNTDIQSEVNSISLWIGPDLGSFGGLLIFEESDQATRAEKLLDSLDNSYIWHSRDGNKLLFVNGDSAWSSSLRYALVKGRRTSIQSHYPKIWNTLTLLPSSSIGIPWAVGFTKVDPAPVDFLVTKAKIDLTGAMPALGGANINHLAFGIYSKDRLEFPDTLTSEWMHNSGIGATAVAESGYPGFLVSLMMGSFLRQGGLEKYPLKGEEVFYGTLGEREKTHVMVKNFGPTLYLALGLDQEHVKDLMGNILTSRDPE